MIVRAQWWVAESQVTAGSRADKSTRPQVCAQLGTDSHSCSYGWADDVPGVPSERKEQVNGVGTRSVAPQRWTTLGAQRHVDLWMKRSTFHMSPARPGTRETKGRDGRVQRQRMDMTRPTIMPPKPIAKFHAPREVMKGILSPAT